MKDMQQNQEEINQEQIEQCYLEMYKCMVEKDTWALSKLLVESFVLVHMTGMKQPKQELLEYIDCGRLRYYSSQMDHSDIKINGESARLIGQSKVSTLYLVVDVIPGHCNLRFNLSIVMDFG